MDNISPEQRAKHSAGMKRFFAMLTPEQKAEWIRCRTGKSGAKTSATFAKKRLDVSWSSIRTQETRRRRVVDEQGGKCNGCGLGEWRGKPIVFELEHKDGNNRNNSRENVEALCPNCHSQTPTWRGRGGEARHKGVTDEMLVAALGEFGTVTGALESLGLNAGGSNYQRAKRLCGSVAQ